VNVRSPPDAGIAFVVMVQPWTTSASASLGAAGGTLTLVEGSAFCISARSGEIDPAHPQGLFFRDTRFLSEFRLELNGAAAESLGASTPDPFSAVMVLRGAPARDRVASHLTVVRRRYVGRGMREDITIENWSDEAAYCALEIIVGVDFADLFEVKEGRVEERGVHTLHADGSRMTFGYAHRSFTRAAHVDFSEAPRISGTTATYELVIAPRGRWSTCVQLTPVIGDSEIAPRYPCGEPVEHATPAARLAEWVRRMPVVTSNEPRLRALLDRSTRELAGLRIFDPEFPDRAVVAAGAPWFMTLFGRDSLLTSWMTMLVDPDLALGTLQTLARFQGRDVDPATDEEPGRILHEMRFGEAASLALGGGHVYYGTADATPLFVMLVGELSRWGVRRDEVDALLPAADAAITWMAEHGDRDGDGYVEYQRASDRGLLNQGWKDSADSMRFADGRLAQTPIALCEVQAYVYGALVARQHCATEAGDDERAGELEAQARELKRRFNRDFWVDRDGGYFALGLDRDKRPIDGVGSNMGHCLWTGIVDEEKAPAVVRALMSEPMFSGWGIRTLSEATGGYNPVSYHCGSVWPHDNAICAAGMMRYGFVDEAHRVMLAMIEASTWFGELLPELFSGMSRTALTFPVSYPTSCSPQAWAAASPLLFLRTLLRFEPDIRASRLHLAPAVPDWIGTLRLEQIQLMGGRLDLEVASESVNVLRAPEGLTVVPSPRLATH
jgi:glycogen debranching enzyme